MVVPMGSNQGDHHLPAESPPQLGLPPGVYFRPTPHESMDFLDRWIDGQAMPDAEGSIFQEDVYSASPDVLRRTYPPGNSRAGEHSWWFLGVSRFQYAGGGRGGRSGRTTRAARQVATGGSWRLEQSKKELPGDIGARNNFGFYTGPSKKAKTAWLMEEYTSARDDGTGKNGMPALYRIYVTPRATDDQIRAIYGEDAVAVLPNGTKKPVRVMVPTEYFDKVAELLPPGSVRGLGPEQNAPPPPQSLNSQEQFLETAPPADVLCHQDQFLEAAPPLPPPPTPPCAVDDDFQEQFFQAAPPLPSCVLDGDFQGQFFEASPPLPGDVEEFQGQYFMEAGTPLPPPGDLDGSQGQYFMESATPLPPTPGDSQGQYLMESATPLPPPLPPLGDLDDLNMWDFSICSPSDFLFEG